jgi:hypothetical protein
MRPLEKNPMMKFLPHQPFRGPLVCKVMILVITFAAIAGIVAFSDGTSVRL